MLYVGNVAVKRLTLGVWLIIHIFGEVVCPDRFFVVLVAPSRQLME
jgi:hypothetical protein